MTGVFVCAWRFRVGVTTLRVCYASVSYDSAHDVSQLPVLPCAVCVCTWFVHKCVMLVTNWEAVRGNLVQVDRWTMHACLGTQGCAPFTQLSWQCGDRSACGSGLELCGLAA